MQRPGLLRRLVAVGRRRVMALQARRGRQQVWRRRLDVWGVWRRRPGRGVGGRGTTVGLRGGCACGGWPRRERPPPWRRLVRHPQRCMPVSMPIHMCVVVVTLAIIALRPRRAVPACPIVTPAARGRFVIAATVAVTAAIAGSRPQATAARQRPAPGHPRPSGVRSPRPHPRPCRRCRPGRMQGICWCAVRSV